MSGGGSVALGSSVTLNNTGVTSIVAGTNISVSGATGAVTVNSTATGLPGILGQVFTASGTFTIPTGVTAVKATLIGGGGGGGGGHGASYGGSGGYGGGAIKYLTGLTSGATITVTVGGGGSGGSPFGNGGAGGNSTITSGTQTITTVTGGGGGGGSSYGGGASGIGTNGSINNTASPCPSFGFNYGIGGGGGSSGCCPGGGGAGTAGLIFIEW